MTSDDSQQEGAKSGGWRRHRKSSRDRAALCGGATKNSEGAAPSHLARGAGFNRRPAELPAEGSLGTWLFDPADAEIPRFAQHLRAVGHVRRIHKSLCVLRRFQGQQDRIERRGRAARVRDRQGEVASRWRAFRGGENGVKGEIQPCSSLHVYADELG